MQRKFLIQLAIMAVIRPCFVMMVLVLGTAEIVRANETGDDCDSHLTTIYSEIQVKIKYSISTICYYLCDIWGIYK